MTTETLTRVDETIALFERIRAAKTDIASLRRQGLHLTASIQRDEMLTQVEAWLDPAAGDVRRAMQAAQGAQAARSSRQIDPACGF